MTCCIIRQDAKEKPLQTQKPNHREIMSRPTMPPQLGIGSVIEIYKIYKYEYIENNKEFELKTIRK